MCLSLEELSGLVPEQTFPSVHKALRERRDAAPSNYADTVHVEKKDRLVLYNISPQELSDELFGLLRKDGRWLLHGGYVSSASNEQGFIVNVFDKQKLRIELPPLGVVYHATEIGNVQTILQSGLKPGRECGKQPRDKKFQESIYCIYASKSLECAINWSKKLATTTASFGYLRVDVAKAGV